MSRAGADSFSGPLFPCPPRGGGPHRRAGSGRPVRSGTPWRARTTGVPFALVYLDLDLFKDVNDSLGHEAGDQLLCLVARRLGECVRSSDVVARMGGDEFTVLIRDMQHPDDIFPVADKILESLSQPFALGAHTVRISASMGAAFHPRDGEDDIELLRAADLAMYAAKEQGRNHFRVYTAAMRGTVRGRDHATPPQA